MGVTGPEVIDADMEIGYEMTVAATPCARSSFFMCSLCVTTASCLLQHGMALPLHAVQLPHRRRTVPAAPPRKIERQARGTERCASTAMGCGRIWVFVPLMQVPTYVCTNVTDGASASSRVAVSTSCRPCTYTTSGFHFASASSAASAPCRRDVEDGAAARVDAADVLRLVGFVEERHVKSPHARSAGMTVLTYDSTPPA